MGADTVITVERCPRDGLAEWTRAHFAQEDALIFIGSVGIAVRAIAPHIVSKTCDPAVVAVDEQGHHAVAVLAGHIGGANALTRRVAAMIGATPVITTGTDARGLFAVDEWATRQGMRIANPRAIKAVSSALLAGQSIRLASEIEIGGDAPEAVEYHHVTDDISRSDEALTAIEQVGGGASSQALDNVVISARFGGRPVTDSGEPTSRDIPADDTVLRLVPAVITAGVGTRRGVASKTIAAAVDQAMIQAGYDPLALAEVASIDLKAHEPGLLAFCAERGVPLITFSANQLAVVDGGFTASSFVASVTGVDNVCERAAVAASGGPLLTRKTSRDAVTVALALHSRALRFDSPSTARSALLQPSPGDPDSTHSPRRTS
jgi:cobalt-precorrin 5A hydrolase